MKRLLLGILVALCGTACAPRCQPQTVTFTWFHADGSIDHVGTQTYLTCKAVR